MPPHLQETRTRHDRNRGHALARAGLIRATSLQVRRDAVALPHRESVRRLSRSPRRVFVSVHHIRRLRARESAHVARLGRCLRCPEDNLQRDARHIVELQPCARTDAGVMSTLRNPLENPLEKVLGKPLSKSVRGTTADWSLGTSQVPKSQRLAARVPLARRTIGPPALDSVHCLTSLLAPARHSVSTAENRRPTAAQASAAPPRT